MKICVISANLGKVDGVIPPRWVEQIYPDEWTVDHFYLDHTNVRLRSEALHPRMQAKIYRMFGWEIFPGYDYYIWLDSAFDIVSMDTVSWMVNRCGNHEIAMFNHSQRKTIKDEADIVLSWIKDGNAYVAERYANEPIEDQIKHYLDNEKPVDDFLVETGAFCYRPTPTIKAMMKDWFYECCRWTCQDQLSLPVVVKRHKVDIEFFGTNIFNSGRLIHTYHNRR